MILPFLLMLVSGFWFLCRICEQPGRPISRIFAFFLFSFGIYLFPRHERFGIWILAFLALQFFLLEWLKVWKFQKNFRDERLEFVENLILEMSSGLSFRDSVRKSIPKSVSSKELTQWMNQTQFTPIEGAQYWDEVVRHLYLIDRSRVHVLQQVKNWREQLRCEKLFRSKSRQVRQQVQLQALIITLLYLGLHGFNFWNFGLNQAWNLIFVSILIFSTGLFLIFRIGSKIKWKF